MKAFDPNSLYYKMASWYHKNKGDDKLIICNEGSSRSSKTQDTFHLIETFCDHNRQKPLKIGIFRNTLKDAREKTYDDFKKFLTEIRGIYDIDCARKENSSPEYFLYGSKIEFRGLDDETEQKGYDIVFVNEALEIDNENKIAGLLMRCTRLVIFDWNPKYTQHWIFNYEKRNNCLFTHTTYKNNKHLPITVVKGIESKSPWHLDDLHLPENERRPHEENIKQGTADEWFFKVYGMGMRANRDGLIFPDVTWIESFPDDCHDIAYGLDFGFTIDPSAFVKAGVKYNNHGKSDLFLELKLYEPTENADILYDKINLIFEKDKHANDYEIWADISGSIMISDLRYKGLTIFAAPKPHGSINYGIDFVKRFNIHIVYCADFKKEQENYAWKTIHGIAVNEPIDKFNHAFDATRYICVNRFRI